MSLSRYSCAVLGEDWAKTANLHPATVRRMRAWCISLHIPVSLWAGSSYLARAKCSPSRLEQPSVPLSRRRR